MPRSHRRRSLPSSAVLLPETSPAAQPRAATQKSWRRSPKPSPSLGFTGTGVFLRPSSSAPASSSVFSYCAPRPNIATEKSWGRSLNPHEAQASWAQGPSFPFPQNSGSPPPRFIFRNPRRAAQRCKPLIARQVPEAPTGLRHHGRRRLPSSALLLLGPPFAFHFPFTAPQRPTLRPMNCGAGSQDATWGPGSKGGKSLPYPSFRQTQRPRPISPKPCPAGPRCVS